MSLRFDFGILLIGNKFSVSSSHSRGNQGLRSALMRDLARPIQEILVIYAPFLFYSLIFALVFYTIVCPQSSILFTSFIYGRNFPLYYFLPAFTLLGILDVSFFFFTISCPLYAVSFMLFFMIRMEENLQQVIDSLKRR